MAILKPWYTVVPPREDLREGKPLDASEFAVHLDQVRDGRAPGDYQKPERFFERTYLTASLTDLAAQVVRRLSGITLETSAVFNFATQFGGGKTHALTLLYHLAMGGEQAAGWRGVRRILDLAQINCVPESATAVFVGTEFDTIRGRGGDDGTPLRRTPWGEIAWQLGGEKSFIKIREHDEKGEAPGGDVIRTFLPQGPCLILMDELVNFMSRSRKSGMTGQLYNFLQNLSETARGREDVALAVSIPSLMDEMTAEDFADFERFKKMLDRLGKAVILAAESETAEIIRRRLFEWQGLPEEGKNTCRAYADWVQDHKSLVGDFDGDGAAERFAACYPLHPALLSVFERKWQALPRFQKTRGMLRLLALWVSRAYQDGYKGAHKDPLIGLGTAPLDDSLFRAAVFEQLGSSDLEGPVTTDITGKKDAHAVRLDKDAPEAIRKTRLHQKIATTILFESNGGQTRAEATVPEIRLAVGEPDLDIANVETALEALADRCYYLGEERNRYRFSLSPNLNKVLADRQSSIQPATIQARVRQEVTAVFKNGPAAPDREYFPEKPDNVTERPALALVIWPPEQPYSEDNTRRLLENVIREKGGTSRTFKSALLIAVADNITSLSDDARKLLAWEDIQSDDETLKRLDAAYQKQLKTNVEKAARDVKEGVWRTYRRVILLGKDNKLREIDLGLVHSSAADSLVTLILNRLRQEGDLEDSISPNFLVRNWPPAFKEWATKNVRDAFFASPQFPRLLSTQPIKETIVKGVSAGALAYVGKDGAGEYQPFYYEEDLSASDVEFADDMFIVKGEVAREYRTRQAAAKETPLQPDSPSTTEHIQPSSTDVTTSEGSTDSAATTLPSKLIWNGEVPSQRWMNFYTKFLSKYATAGGLKLSIRVEASPTGGVSTQRLDETRTALRELGLSEDLTTE